MLTYRRIFNVGLEDGGPAGLVYGYLFCWAGYTAVIASLAELVSMIPTAGGQYHWTFELATPKYRKFVSYITGENFTCRPQKASEDRTDPVQAGRLSGHGKPFSHRPSILAAPLFRA